MKKAKFKVIFAAIFMCVLLAVGMLPPANFATVYAAESTYSDVMTDLTKDSKFDANDYPENANDYSIQVIQIAESPSGELFVYTYQPCQKTTYITATEINMSLLKDFDEDNASGSGDDTQNPDSSGGDQSGTAGGGFGGGGGSSFSLRENPLTRLYGLTLLSGNGVFCKYKVNDFAVIEDETRYYNITSIFRKWLKGIDAETGNDNTKNAVACKVGKLYTVTTANGEVSYKCEKREVVKILNPYAGYLRYADGFFLKTTACDSHYVAFSTDWNIDALYEADVSYQSRGVHRYYNLWEGHGTRYDEWQPQYAFLTDKQEFEKERTGWLFGSEAKYSRIQSVEKFIESETLTDKTEANLNGKQWVLRFAETDFSYNHDGDYGDWSEVSNVTVLRLKFKSAGVVYNLGTVSDKVTEGKEPSNVKPELNFWQYVWNCVVKLFQGKADFVETLVAIVVILVVLVLFPLGMFILSMIFPAFRAVVKLIFNGIWSAVVWLVKGLWWIICLPFRGIAALFKAIAGKRKARKTSKPRKKKAGE